MSIPDFHPTDFSSFSPLSNHGDRNTIYRSPASYAEPFPAPHGDVAFRGIEMREGARPGGPQHQESTQTAYSTTSTLFPAQGPAETQSFLHDPVNKIDTFYTSNAFQPYKDNTGRQLRHILIEGSTRWLITFAMCGAYVLATVLWQKKVAQGETSKRMYNAITTGVSIALGLNIASAFKDMALNMRWVILSNRKRSLVEMDLLLHADSMQKLTKLVFVTRRPTVIFGCIFWLLVNIMAQAGIAMISLTYGFNTDTNHVQYQFGSVAVPNMTYFFPQGNFQTDNPSWQDMAYTAHVYGESAMNLGIDDIIDKPSTGAIYQTNTTIWADPDNSLVQVVFSDSPSYSISPGSFSVYTARTINATYACDSHKVTAGGDGTTTTIEVGPLGNITVDQTVPNSTTFFVAADSTCADDARCQVVQALEASATDPWYYTCNITLSNTYNDPVNISHISDLMAQIAASAIAQTGFVDAAGATAVTYPRDSPWGVPASGAPSPLGLLIAEFAMGAIAGASLSNPFISYAGAAPSAGVYLELGHPYFFYLILGLICGCHLFFLIAVAVLANRVMVGPEGALSMALLLRPIADALEGISGGKENRAFRDAKRNTMVRYEKGRSGKWTLNTS